MDASWRSRPNVRESCSDGTSLIGPKIVPVPASRYLDYKSMVRTSQEGTSMTGLSRNLLRIATL